MYPFAACEVNEPRFNSILSTTLLDIAPMTCTFGPRDAESVDTALLPILERPQFRRKNKLKFVSSSHITWRPNASLPLDL